jgi:hypothetical protein
VAFPIDVSQPFRYPSELKRLVNAVREAGKYDETRWIEWKSTLDLGSPAGIRHLAKNVLGFANRDPQVASTWAAGYAYVIVGASPGELNGVKPIDPERLTSQVQPYVGGEITWTPEYVMIENLDVLVVVVEPPRSGDSIHALRKDLDRYRAGIILIRRPGQTVQADPDEVAMLSRRLLARGTQIDLAVEPTATTIEAQPDFSDLPASWTQTRRSQLLEAAAKPPAGSEARGQRAGGFSLSPWASSLLSEHEHRIDEYLEDARKVQLERCVWRLSHHSPATLELAIVNRTVHNFAQVRVTLEMKAEGITVFDGDLLRLINDTEPKLPTPPPVNTSPMYQLSNWPGFQARMLTSPPSFRQREWVAHKADDQVHIEFDAQDVRPHDTVRLPTVPLLIAAQPETVIAVEWSSTATNVNGTARGTFGICLTKSTFCGDWMN